ncbi:aspartate kinase [Winogradskyella echinorum]|uniref:Homoserine dehydrogenase n=1 Tax=Winogradskyella echinorum TaxID=538189 RepID=A0ABR6Y171_9FLAO|nr:aspartate kinase [Winogradskyella echinorum]MBC3846020.1 aspartate kinase [Winogradskyella echinorum]MBC5750368.1 aspartate kinase [Winogradskyella echinorum]
MTTVNLVIFGIGNVGSTLIDQIQEINHRLIEDQQLELQLSAIANSKKALFGNHTSKNWSADFKNVSTPYKIEEIIEHFNSNKLENRIAIDVTASETFVYNYELLINNGFHIISANKIANTLSFNFYKNLRNVLKRNHKKFLYETNVGAGLPIIETVRNLYQSGDNITKIRGVFSGSLSYIFNRFSEEQIPFNEILHTALEEGLTEPDPREDLSGKDVARKLLILARELGVKTELNDVKVESLVPQQLHEKTTLEQFIERSIELNPIFEKNKNSQSSGSVLRYLGELDIAKNSLEVKLVSEPKSSSLGQLKGSDTLFELYTEGYNQQPLVIQGAGAGNTVTARGVLSDVLKLSESLN